MVLMFLMNMASCLSVHSVHKASSACLKNEENTSDLMSVGRIASNYNLESGVGRMSALVGMYVYLYICCRRQHTILDN